LPHRAKAERKKKYKTKIRKKEEVKGRKDKVTNPKRKTKKKDRWWRGVIHVSQNPPFLYHHPILPTQKHNSPVQPFRCALSFNQKKKDVHCPFGQTRRRRDLKERELWKKKRSRRRRRDLEEEEEKEEIWKKDRSVANCFLFFLFFVFFFFFFSAGFSSSSPG
jgi:hypothetical protein